ncbi:MAG: DUF5615 family PIN-like protein [candidate division KSB1 bacterium]|nr:DUF5615 family PIN-like protein [candidate division KSB1 bacterium]MDZ7301533.1 DUF5615 family PIN-like protein [candidate division KSB1 bacterium]MDZ7311051.1 DUF5615 family PIN-like protein [candidate division KSB1 bacterium]
MKFLVDMGISPKSADFLRSLGYDAVHLLDQGLGRLPDPDILEKARMEGRVLLTHDLGFGELVAASGTQLPSVIIFRLNNMKPERVDQYLREIISKHQDALVQGVIMSVTEGKIRVHHLPLKKGD